MRVRVDATCCTRTQQQTLSARRGAQAAAAAGRAFPAVPWSLDTTAAVMALWFLLFFVVGPRAATVLPDLLDVDPGTLTASGIAVGYMLCDAINLLFTLALIFQVTRPQRLWEMGLFTLRPTRRAAAHVALACLAFPLIDFIYTASQPFFPLPPADQLSLHLEQSLLAGDALANAVYVAVVAVCAPVWEESIFRGFLLTSLARYLPPAAAVAASSAAFAAAHSSWPSAPYLAVLGCVIGTVFVRTRSLLAAMLVHSIWNMYVFAKVAFLPSAGAAFGVA